MKCSNVLWVGMFVLLSAVTAPALADVLPPSGGSAAYGGATGNGGAFSAAGSESKTSSDDDGGCSVAFARNTSAVAAGLIAIALTAGMLRLRRYGMR